jgi:hypothetical protein
LNTKGIEVLRAKWFVILTLALPAELWSAGPTGLVPSRVNADFPTKTIPRAEAVAPSFDLPRFSGLITPHDYQARGIEEIFEPEGIADSIVLRGRMFFAEMDTRTFTDAHNGYGRVDGTLAYGPLLFPSDGSGPKRIALPENRAVYDLITGEKIADHARGIAFSIKAPQTRAFYLAELNP